MNVEEFLEKGYLLMPNAIPAELLDKWRNNAREIEKEALAASEKGESLKGACVIEDPVGSRLMRYDDLFFNYLEDFNELVSAIPMLNIMKQLCGPSSIIIQADLLYKHQHPHPVIKWHQGAPHARNHPYLNVGIYLDDADQDDGCLSYVPGSQHALVEIEAIESKYGWNPPDVVQQPTKAGDILVQDMMILHSSMPKRSPGARRTIYVEIRPYEAVIEENPQLKQWADLRREWTNQVLKMDETNVFTAQEKEFYKNEPRDKQDLIRDLVEHRHPPTPAVYSIFPTEGPDYPIPSDLK